jgi:hypothetical protein
MSTLGIIAAPSAVPALDQAAVEVARERRVRRDRLVGSCPSVTVAMLAEGRGVAAASVRSWLHRHRTAGRLVTVEHDGQVLVPGFQLDPDLQLRPQVAAVTGQLTAAGMDGWAVWAWWTSYNAVLEANPIDLLDTGRTDQVAAAVDRLVDPQG